MSLKDTKKSQSMALSSSKLKLFDRIESDIKAILDFAFQQNKIVKWTLLYSGIVGFATLISIWLFQPYFKHIGLSIFWFGILWAILNLAAALTAQKAWLVEKRMGLFSVFLIIPLSIGISLILFGTMDTIFMVLFAISIQGARGLKTPLVYALLNRETSSQMRASIISIDNLITRLIFTIFAPIIGWLADLESIHFSFILVSVVVMVLSGTCLYKLKKYKAV